MLEVEYQRRYGYLRRDQQPRHTMSKEETPFEPGIKQIAADYLVGLNETVQNWPNLSEERKKQALGYYGYTLAVLVGAPIAGVVAFASRL